MLLALNAKLYSLFRILNKISYLNDRQRQIETESCAASLQNLHSGTFPLLSSKLCISFNWMWEINTPELKTEIRLAGDLSKE